MKPSEFRIGFLGAGQIATALARAWLAVGLLRPQACQASDPDVTARSHFAAQIGCSTVDDNKLVVQTCDLLILAVKPHILPEVLLEIRSQLLARQPLVVSVAAGVSLRQLSQGLGGYERILRVMPNIPCLVGASAAGYAVGTKATPEDVVFVDQLLAAVGRAFRLPEHLLDAVTGLSGSGPAFVYLMIEALADGGVRVGLSREVAQVLAAQTVLGAAKMVLETGIHPGALKDRVASPGGTTIAGLHELERAGVRGALMNAVQAAARRATELGEGLK